MANHKSALKRNRQNQVRRMRNRANKSRMKSAIKNVLLAIESESADEAREALRKAVSIIDKTAIKGTIHKRNAARNISRLTRRVNALSNNAEAAA